MQQKVTKQGSNSGQIVLRTVRTDNGRVATRPQTEKT
jgi:hypothetical protein